MMKRFSLRAWVVGLCLALTGCGFGATEAPIRVRVIVDGQTKVLSASEPLSVRQLLQRENITVGDLDKVNPNDFTPIVDGMVITIVRVENRAECEEDVLPYATETIKTPDLPPGTTRVMQPGVTGTVRVCYDVVYHDGVEKSRVQASRTILTPATNQIVALGIDRSRIEPIPVTGLIAYLSGGQARYIERNSTNQDALPTGGSLDGDVFELSPDGRQLLYTRKPDDPSRNGEIRNELWVLLDTSNPDAEPVRLIIDNVLTAAWVPGEPFTFSYSTLQPRAEPPGYQALNDLNIARLDSKTGKILRADPVIKPGPTSVYGLWGTKFAWSPDGEYLAWAQADGVGLVDLKQGALRKLFDFEVYATTLSRGWLWTPNLAWTQDGNLLTATIHGDPLHNESPETSPVFDIAAIQAGGAFQINPMKAQTGMWAAPRYSPLVRDAEGVLHGKLAYLQARNPIDSVSSAYDLVIADLDGSNARAIFPGKDKEGIRPLEDGNEIAWSPDGRQIALIYQGDVYIVDVESGRATQVTIVGNVRHPRWVR